MSNGEPAPQGRAAPAGGDAPKRPAPRSYYEAQLQKLDGVEVPEETLRVYEREEQLCRAALAYPRALEGSGVRAPMFDAADYRIFWAAYQRAVAVHKTDAPIHPENVLAEMRVTEPRFSPPRGNLWMGALKTGAPVDINYTLEILAPELIHRFQLRGVRAQMTPLLGRVDKDTDVLALHQEVLTAAHAITQTPDGGRLGKTFQEMTWDPTRRGNPNIIPLGIPQIDKAAAGGHGRGDLMVVGAGTNQGKSYFAQRLMRNQARMNRKALYVSVEDPEELMQLRMYADYSIAIGTPLSAGDMRQGLADPVVVYQAIEAMAKEQQHRLYFAECRKWKVSDICAVIRRHRYLAGVDLVIVDYLQAIQPDEENNNKVQEVSYIVAKLKKTCHECGVALVLLSQLARDDYRNGAEPTINGCKYAGDIENECEIMVLLWRDDEDGPLRGKLAKLKWSKAAGRRYLIQTHPVNGVLGDWQDDFAPPGAAGGTAARGRGGGGGNGHGGRGGRS